MLPQAWPVASEFRDSSKHPLRWLSLQCLGVSQQPDEVVERVGAIQFAGVYETHYSRRFFVAQA